MLPVNPEFAMSAKIFLVFAAPFTPWAAMEPASINLADAVESLSIIEIESLDAIEDTLGGDTLYFFDIDDTLIDSPNMLGSKGWRKYIKAKTVQEARNWHDIFTFYLLRKYPVMTVEPGTLQFILNLQRRGCAVFGLTARERNKWYDTPASGVDALTVHQLTSLGMHFEDHSAYASLLSAPEYYRGTFFVDSDLKGEYLTRLFLNADEKPKRVVFVDDKKKQAESVAEALTMLHIPHVCYWYVATDKKSRNFDPKVANIQLYHYLLGHDQRILSDEEAHSIGLENPEKQADEYLQEILKMASQLPMERFQKYCLQSASQTEHEGEQKTDS